MKETKGHHAKSSWDIPVDKYGSERTLYYTRSQHTAQTLAVLGLLNKQLAIKLPEKIPNTAKC